MSNITELASTQKEEAALQRKAEAGRQAAEVLANPAYEAAWKNLRDSIAQAWRDCAVGDSDTMELLHSQARMLDQLQALLGAAINGGKAAAADLQAAAAKLAQEETNERMRSRGLRGMLRNGLR